MLKTGRKYLHWVQNSVFEGQINKAKYEKMIIEMKRIIDEGDGDSLVVYRFRKMKYYKREVYGKDKKGNIKFI